MFVEDIITILTWPYDLINFSMIEPMCIVKRTLVKSWSYLHKSYVQRFVTNLSTNSTVVFVWIFIIFFNVHISHLFYFFNISTYRSSHTMCTEITLSYILSSFTTVTSSQLLWDNWKRKLRGMVMACF